MVGGERSIKLGDSWFSVKPILVGVILLLYLGMLSLMALLNLP